jgi:HNH endonuclease
MMLTIPERDYLLKVFCYKDGKLIGKVRPFLHFSNSRQMKIWNSKFAGKRVGRVMSTSHYRQVMLNGIRYLEHRIVAKMFKLSVDGYEVDHIDGDSLNNRIENLRIASRQQNMQNNSGWRKKSLRLGVSKKVDGKFVAYIRKDGRHLHLGTFPNEVLAAKAREQAERSIYGGRARKAS